MAIDKVTLDRLNKDIENAKADLVALKKALAVKRAYLLAQAEEERKTKHLIVKHDDFEPVNENETDKFVAPVSTPEEKKNPANNGTAVKNSQIEVLFVEFHRDLTKILKEHAFVKVDASAPKEVQKEQQETLDLQEAIWSGEGASVPTLEEAQASAEIENYLAEKHEHLLKPTPQGAVVRSDLDVQEELCVNAVMNLIRRANMAAKQNRSMFLNKDSRETFAEEMSNGVRALEHKLRGNAVTGATLLPMAELAFRLGHFTSLPRTSLPGVKEQLPAQPGAMHPSMAPPIKVR